MYHHEGNPKIYAQINYHGLDNYRGPLWLSTTSLEDFYGYSKYINYIHIEFNTMRMEFRKPHVFDNLEKILEETIHACLPDPDAWLCPLVEDEFEYDYEEEEINEIEYMWKFYFHDLLANYEKDQNT